MTTLPSSQGKDAIRRANLSAMLGTLVRDGAQSRSELIQRLRLSRTTVAELAAQLGELGLVDERAPETTTGVGRPSTVVHPAHDVVAFAVDPEVDAVSVGVVALDGTVRSLRRVAAPPIGHPDRVAELAATAIDELWATLPSNTRAVGCGVAVPGQVDAATGTVLRAVSMGWSRTDLGGMLSSRIGLPVTLGNNARLVMRAEHLMGAARGSDDVVSIFAGAGGIGGGIVSSGITVTGTGGFAGEIGQVRVSLPGDQAGEIVRGTFSALVRRDDLVRSLGVTDLSDAELDALVATSDSPAFRALAERHLTALVEVVADLANLLNPHVIVLGGFLGSLYRRFADRVDAALADNVIESIGAQLRVETASDTTEMVLTGAAHMVWDTLIANPLDTPTFSQGDANGRRRR